MAAHRNTYRMLICASLGMALFAVFVMLSGLAAEASSSEPIPGMAVARLPEQAPTLPIPSYQSIDASAVLTYSISGRTFDRFGDPLSGVLVGAGGGRSALSDASGQYTITEVIAGAYTLTPQKIGYTFVPTSTLVSVPPDSSGHNFTGTLPSISGQVVSLLGEPVSGVEVGITGGLTTTTGADGQYEFTDVFSGTYVLLPVKIGYAFAPTSTLVSVPPSAGNRNFTATLASRIRGRLICDYNGLPMRHRLIKARRDVDSEQAALLADVPGFALEYSTFTDEDGNYEFDPVIEGSYVLYSGEIGFTLTPASYSVSVPPDAEGHNFTGTFEVHLPLIVGGR